MCKKTKNRQENSFMIVIFKINEDTDHHKKPTTFWNNKNIKLINFYNNEYIDHNWSKIYLDNYIILFNYFLIIKKLKNSKSRNYPTIHILHLNLLSFTFSVRNSEIKRKKYWNILLI